MTVMSESLPLNSKYIKTGLEEEGFKLSSDSHLLLSFAMWFNHLTFIIYGFATVRRTRGSWLWTLVDKNHIRSEWFQWQWQILTAITQFEFQPSRGIASEVCDFEEMAEIQANSS